MSFDILIAGDRLHELLTIRAYQKRRVILSSGKESDFYIDVRKVSFTAEGSFLIGSIFFQMLKGIYVVEHPLERYVPPNKRFIVAGLALGACPLVTAVTTISEVLGDAIDGLIVRKEAKEHGTKAKIEGFIPPPYEHYEVVVLEDVITTGQSALTAIVALQEQGFAVNRVFAVVDRQEGGKEFLQDKGFRVESLFTKASFE